MIATSGFLAAFIQCTKFVFGRSFARTPLGGAYSTPPDSLAGLKGKGRRRGEEGKGMGDRPFTQISGYAPGTVLLVSPSVSLHILCILLNGAMTL